ncbi:hypothetical protein [Undibacterium umbellatum]|jgi:hypothetical protein|uniref:Uncharacterized protein n=1 Tax=Undibacterium umbellatum TaxID=2762300 RepID=A0ABR6ZEZ4_9BURK|nr:hypothetical protein [Undibacterium umbellatum]MBC3910312.1 hypothetical protein [Undibacterium umbellatum]
MKKYLLLASAFICSMNSLPIASAADLPSDAVRLYAKNAKVDVLLNISYESEDLATIDAFRKALADLGLAYKMEFSVTTASNKVTSKKWKLKTSNKVDLKDNNVDNQVSTLYETVKSKSGSFSWDVATTPK